MEVGYGSIPGGRDSRRRCCKSLPSCRFYLKTSVAFVILWTIIESVALIWVARQGLGDAAECKLLDKYPMMRFCGESAKFCLTLLIHPKFGLMCMLYMTAECAALPHIVTWLAGGNESTTRYFEGEKLFVQDVPQVLSVSKSERSPAPSNATSRG